jgi:SAM-dependent methyltransferase
MNTQQRANYQTSYDLVADEYVRRVFDELEHKPFDRHLLDRFAASVRGMGLSCDMGCGPGHVARYLHRQGTQVFGVDLSPAMVEQARRLVPGVDFRQGDMLALDAEDEAWVGIAAFYSIIHIPRGDLPSALAEFHRVLRPGGVLLLAFHIGDDTIHLDEWWGQKVCVDFFWFHSDEVAGHLHSAGFEIEEIIERDPIPDVEYQTRRAYIFARRPKTSETAYKASCRKHGNKHSPNRVLPARTGCGHPCYPPTGNN